MALLRADAGRFRSAWQSSGVKFLVRLILFTPGFQFAFSLRLQAVLRRIPLVGPLLGRMLWYATTLRFSSDVDPTAIFGPGIYFPHPYGIVIGVDTVIGPNVTILHQVTIGRRGRPPYQGVQIGANAEIGAGAKVIGNIRIGQGSQIGANSVVLSDVPDRSLAVGIPARSRSLDASA